MTTTRFRRRRLGPSTGLMVAAAVALAAATLWPRPDPATIPATSAAHLVAPADQPTGPVEIVEVDTSVIWADQQIPPVRIEVRNNASRSVTAKVWWLLAAPAQTRPWVDPAARGRVLSGQR